MALIIYLKTMTRRRPETKPNSVNSFASMITNFILFLCSVAGLNELTSYDFVSMLYWHATPLFFRSTDPLSRTIRHESWP